MGVLGSAGKVIVFASFVILNDRVTDVAAT